MTSRSRSDPFWLRASPSTAPPPMAKTTVYLGSELIERINQLRLRGIDINVSKVCQLALGEALAEAESLPQAARPTRMPRTPGRRRTTRDPGA